jgi:hypothetical protein
MESLRRSLTMLVAFSISLSTSAEYPRRDGRTYQHLHALRQGPFAGIQTISSISGPPPTDVLPSDGIVPGSVITAVSIPVSPTDPLSQSTVSLIAHATSKIFPITVTQIPVATICAANQSQHLPVQYTRSPINITNLLNSTDSVHPLLNTTASFPNATANFPIPANTSIASPTVILADPSVRIILGDNGCQTLFTPTTTAICSTVLPIGGQVPISVTDCGQWVTFSSSPVCGGATVAAPSGTAETTAYFLAPWYEIALGAVPATVQVQTCSAFGHSTSSNCVTASESWSVRTVTVPSTLVQTAKFSGGAVGVSLLFFSFQTPAKSTPMVLSISL